MSPSSPARRLATRARLVGLCLGAATVAACEYDRTVIDQGPRRVAVHAVLNPGAPHQDVLVEEVLTGQGEPWSGSFDPQNPVVSGGGVPVEGARVVIDGPEEGDSALAFEARPGVYRVSSPRGPCSPIAAGCLFVRPGARYRLRVAAGGGEVVGATTVPDAQPIFPASPGFAFDRERDALELAWNAVPTARRYALRIESPRGPYSAFLSDTAYRVAGTLRNPLEQTLPSVFMPGFVQSVSVAAVDSNYYDYFRSTSNPFTGTGLINRLEGGIGVFGSWVLLRQRTLVVTAPEDEPIEGRYVRPLPGPFISSIRLWVESRARGTTYLSGRYQTGGDGAQRGLLGILAGDDVTLVFLSDQLASDTSRVYRGRVQADGSLLGCFEGRETGCGQHFVKSP